MNEPTEHQKTTIRKIKATLDSLVKRAVLELLNKQGDILKMKAAAAENRVRKIEVETGLTKAI